MSKIICHRKKNWHVYYYRGCKHYDPVITGLPTEATLIEVMGSPMKLPEKFSETMEIRTSWNGKPVRVPDPYAIKINEIIDYLKSKEIKEL